MLAGVLTVVLVDVVGVVLICSDLVAGYVGAAFAYVAGVAAGAAGEDVTTAGATAAFASV